MRNMLITLVAFAATLAGTAGLVTTSVSCELSESAGDADVPDDPDAPQWEVTDTPLEVTDIPNELPEAPPGFRWVRVTDAAGDMFDSLVRDPPSNEDQAADLGGAEAAAGTVSEVGYYFVPVGSGSKQFEASAFHALISRQETLTGGVVLYGSAAAALSDSTEVLVVQADHVAPIPIDDSAHSYIYSLVADSNGNAADNWIVQGDYGWDIYQGTDRWYRAIYSHTSRTWTLEVIQVNEAQQQVRVTSSAARAAILGGSITWIIPLAELPAIPLRFDATAFVHDGVYSESDRGCDVLGANPTIPKTEI